MLPPAKRIKLEESPKEELQLFSLLPRHVIIQILNYVRYSDIKSVALVNKQFNEIISERMKNKTYVYVHNLKQEDLPLLLNTGRKFNEVFFYGRQSPDCVSQILQEFGRNLTIIKLAKNDLKFMKVPWNEFSDWLNHAQHITELDLTNIEIVKSSTEAASRVLMQKLKKLKCYDSSLNTLVGPNLDKLELDVLDRLSSSKVACINSFVEHHYKITHFSLRVFCDDDTDVQDVPLKLGHLKLRTLILREFRYNAADVAKIISEQKELIKLHLEDGSLSNEDGAYSRRLKQVFDEILELKKLNKLVIEMPSVDFIIKLQNMPNLKRLSITNIAQSDLRLLTGVGNTHLEKLCIENIEYGKKALEKGDIDKLRGLQSLTTLKIDTTPLFVVQELLTKYKDLKVLKIIRNSEVAKKFKQLSGEHIQLPTTDLEKIICDSNDFKLRIMPIVRVSPKLAYIKIYWDNKNTSFVSMAFDVIKACPNIKTIEFKHDGTYVKEDILSEETHFNFSRNDAHFEAIILRKEAKITCHRI